MPITLWTSLGLCGFVGNHQLVRVLPHIYSTNREPVNKHIGPLIEQLKLCDETEKSDLLQVVSLVAKDKPSVSSNSIHN